MSLQYLYESNVSTKNNLKVSINLYPLKVMYWTNASAGILDNSGNQISNVVYEINEEIETNSKYENLLGTKCKVKENSLICEKQSVDDANIQNVKKNIKEVVNNQLGYFFTRENFFFKKK